MTGFAIVGILWGLHNASRSPMFRLQVLEISDQPENAPVDTQTLTQLAAVPIGEISLFDLDLVPIEARLISHPWIRSVRLQKQFPQTLSIAVDYRTPVALSQGDDGNLSYVDADGKLFGRLILNYYPNLPVLSGVSQTQTVPALQLLNAWDKAGMTDAQLSSLQWDFEKGYRMWVTHISGRFVIDLGQDLDAEEQFRRLKQVFGYLKTQKIQVQQIWADAGKKIVVRSVRGS